MKVKYLAPLPPKILPRSFLEGGGGKNSDIIIPYVSRHYPKAIPLLASWQPPYWPPRPSSASGP